MGLVRSIDARHRYQHCQDEYCELPYCRIYREGYEAGYADGHAAGYSAGRVDGYSDGQADAAE